MTSSAHTVYREVFQSLKLGEFTLFNMIHVCAVGDVAESESEYRSLKMHSTDRNDFYAVDTEWLFIYDMNIPFRGTRVFMFSKRI